MSLASTFPSTVFSDTALVRLSPTNAGHPRLPLPPSIPSPWLSLFRSAPSRRPSAAPADSGVTEDGRVASGGRCCHFLRKPTSLSTTRAGLRRPPPTSGAAAFPGPRKPGGDAQRRRPPLHAHRVASKLRSLLTLQVSLSPALVPNRRNGATAQGAPLCARLLIHKMEGVRPDCLPLPAPYSRTVITGSPPPPSHCMVVSPLDRSSPPAGKDLRVSGRRQPPPPPPYLALVFRFLLPPYSDPAWVSPPTVSPAPLRTLPVFSSLSEEGERFVLGSSALHF
ncbi:WAS/WASL-interacting protein family member 2-like [Dromiciops gliroides]|uniref:WAS/WASL-interacting protein family member 2-like n=1 Tax=Dromiciops gliroides TaxID=33562 RepID=UPI001CC6DC0D|nr:WAS/WASL-interacting protein family member 2-like [Dromiciops gliroides]